MRRFPAMGFSLALLAVLSLGTIVLMATEEPPVPVRCEVPFPSCQRCERNFIDCCKFCGQPEVACLIACETQYGFCVERCPHSAQLP